MLARLNKNFGLLAITLIGCFLVIQFTNIFAVTMLACVAAIAISITALSVEPEYPEPKNRPRFFIPVLLTTFALSLLLGNWAIFALGAADLTPAWVILVMGVHIIFAAYYANNPYAMHLGVGLLGVGALGIVLGLLVTTALIPWVLVVSGFMILAYSAIAVVSYRKNEEIEEYA